MWTQEELDEEKLIQEQLDRQNKEDAERYHQQTLEQEELFAMDEVRDSLTAEEQKEQMLWRLENLMREAEIVCGFVEVGKVYARIQADAIMKGLKK